MKTNNTYKGALINTNTIINMLRYKTKIRPGLVALYDIRPGNGADPFLQPLSPHGAIDVKQTVLRWHRMLGLCFNGHLPGGPGTRMSPFWILLLLRTTEVTTGITNNNPNYNPNLNPKN